jgi:uroporphyrinogen decarboxylase
MSSSRERVLKSLNFKPVDRLPRDLGGMASTGISCFAYPRLVSALGLKPRLPKIFDTYQMLALPDMDVLDALGCDVVTVFWGVTNAFEQPGKWQNYNFNGRLDALVRDKTQFCNLPDGSITQPAAKLIMGPNATVFDEEHGGQPLDLSSDLPRPDLNEIKKQQEKTLPTDQEIKATVDLCRQVRNSTDKAVFFNGPINTGLAITAHGGLALFPMLCLTEPGYVSDLHGLMTGYAIKRMDLLLPEIAPYIDIIMMASDDWGTQNSLIAPPYVFEQLFKPYLMKINCHAKKLAPSVKLFLHSCGAIYDILDLIIESGFDILNPIQWPAGSRSYKDWKDKCRKRIAMWGGGVNTQLTLPMASVDQISSEVRQIYGYLKQDSGYVFNAIHNLLADTSPEKIIALYRASQEK